jgi:hypothetical protein
MLDVLYLYTHRHEALAVGGVDMGSGTKKARKRICRETPKLAR